MARSSLAGARAPLRGKLGSTVYQVRRIDGKSTQIAKAAEDSRVNNNTNAQARYRMCYASVCHVLSDLADIIPEFIEDGLTSIRSLDYWSSKALYDVQDNFDEHFEESSPFDYARRAENGARSGEYQFAFGTLNRGAGMSTTHTHQSIGGYDYVDWSISGAPVGCTVGQWLKNARLDANQTIYVVAFACNDYEAVGQYFYARIRAKEGINQSALWANVDPNNILWYSGTMPIEFVRGQNTTLMIRFDPKETTDYRLIRCYGQSLREFYKNRWCVRSSWLTYPVMGSAGIQGNFSPESIYNEYWINEPVPPTPDPYTFLDYVAVNECSGFLVSYLPNLREDTIIFDAAIEGSINRFLFLTESQNASAVRWYYGRNNNRMIFASIYNGEWVNDDRFIVDGFNVRHVLKVVGKQITYDVYYDDNLKASDKSLNDYNYAVINRLRLFGTTTYKFIGKFYGMKVYKTESLQIMLDLRPAIRTADNVVGIYDQINDVFYTDESFSAPA